MADSKITSLTELAAAPASGDFFVIVDVSDTTMASSGTNKKLAANRLLAADGSVTGATGQAQVFTNSVGIGGAPSVPLSVVGTPSTPVSGGLNATAYIESTRPGIAHHVVATSGGGASVPLNDIYVTNDTTSNLAVWRHGVVLSLNQGGVPSLTRYWMSVDSGSTPWNSPRIIMQSDGLMAIGQTSSTALLDIAAATTSAAALRLRAGTAPTSPNDGDFWKNTDEFVMHAATSNTSTILNTLRLRRGSSGTPATGFGSALNFQLKSSTTTGQDAGRLTWQWATATHASRAATGKLTAFYTSTEREAITWTATASSATIAVAGTLTASEKISGSATGESLALGGSNTATYINIAGTRTYIGYDGNNALVLQGGTSKGINFCADNATFGSGVVMSLTSAGVLDVVSTVRTSTLYVDGDAGGAASTNTLTNVSDVTANSTGVGTIKFKGATSRDSAGFIKIYIGTTAYYVPVFSAITG